MRYSITSLVAVFMKPQFLNPVKTTMLALWRLLNCQPHLNYDINFNHLRIGSYALS
jgi:hypothetical protein